MKDKSDHRFCCDTMFKAISQEKIIAYEPIDRSYSIEFEENMARDLSFCPWCGVKLPETLHSKIFDVIWDEFGIPICKADLENYTNIPKEFATDEWWRKRGL